MSEPATVFLVDDDIAVRNALALWLAQAGITVKPYPSAQAFLEDYRPEEPGCLVLDLSMPEMSGLGLQRALIEKQCRIPIIFISGHGDIPTSVQAIKAGAVDFLEKPFSKEVLLDRIEEAIAEDRRQRDQADAAASIQARYERLTPRERQIMARITAGASNKQIASELDLSTRTVENHRARVMKKMDATNVAELCQLEAICRAGAD